MARRLVYIAAPIWLGSSRPRRREVLRGSVNSDRVRHVARSGRSAMASAPRDIPAKAAASAATDFQGSQSFSAGGSWLGGAHKAHDLLAGRASSLDARRLNFLQRGSSPQSPPQHTWGMVAALGRRPGLSFGTTTPSPPVDRTTQAPPTSKDSQPTTASEASAPAPQRRSMDRSETARVMSAAPYP